MENFNKESTSQQPYWNHENRAIAAGSSSGTAARMKLADMANFRRHPLSRQRDTHHRQLRSSDQRQGDGW
jgi:hypothetical protein